MGDDRLDHLAEALGELRGRLGALEGQVARITAPPPPDPLPDDKHGGIKTAITFASLVIVPIVVSLLGGYFALRAAGLR